MNTAEWEDVLKAQIKFDRDYIPSFETTVQILSEMLAERDRVYKAYVDTGAQPVVNFTSDRGAINLKQNPLLKQWHDLNVAALSYLRDLGLTPAGLRKLQGQLPKDIDHNSQLSRTLEHIREMAGQKQTCEPLEPTAEIMQGIRTNIANGKKGRTTTHEEEY